MNAYVDLDLKRPWTRETLISHMDLEPNGWCYIVSYQENETYAIVSVMTQNTSAFYGSLGYAAVFRTMSDAIDQVMMLAEGVE